MKYYIGEIISKLPHIKIPFPYRCSPNLFLNIYIDSELSLPLGIREPELYEFFATNKSRYNCFIDIGAHIGTYSLLFSHITGGETHAFEPHLKNFERLHENIKLNNLNNIKPINKAVYESEKKLKLIEGESSLNHRVSETSSQNGGEIEATTIDNYCEENNLSPDLIKIDIEGKGGSALKGAEDVIREIQPDWIFEIHSTQEKRNMVGLLRERNYIMKNLTSSKDSFKEGDHVFATTGELPTQ